MVKKIFPVLLIVILVIFVFDYQTANPQIKKILNLKNKQITGPEDVLPKPTDISQRSVTELEKIFLQINEPKDNMTVNNQAITVIGKTISNGFVFVNDQEFKADSNGSFSTTVILDEGENYILVVVSDEYGNSVEKDILVNLETT